LSVTGPPAPAGRRWPAGWRGAGSGGPRQIGWWWRTGRSG